MLTKEISPKKEVIKMERHFTREQVVDFCLEMHSKALGKIEITSVKLIEDEEIPVVLYKVDLVTPHGTGLVDLIVESEYEPEKFRLWPLVGFEIRD